MGIIEATGLTRRFGSRTAVDALNLDVAAGSVTGFLGPNGAGKTTTIRMLLGLIHPTAGQARVCGVPVQERKRMTARVGAIVETPAFYGALTARENLRVLALTQGLRLARARLDQVLDRVGLGQRGNEPVQGFSLGMKQRLGVAAALLPDPQVLFLDEPTNGLDPQGQVEMRTLLASLPAEGRTVFVSSHLLRDVELICTDVVIVHKGRNLVQGSVKSLLADAAKVRARVDNPAAALAVVQRERPRLGCTLAGEQLVVPVPADASADGLAADLARVLIGAGLAVFELTPTRDGLEQYFLELTKEEA
jgi:ABC-2 type transport system ATP-binding protein